MRTTGIALSIIFGFVVVCFQYDMQIIKINNTSSLPHGLYARTFTPFHIGSLAWFRVPENRPSVDSPSMKEYLSNYPLWGEKFSKKRNGLLKPIVAMTEDIICRKNNVFNINDKDTETTIEETDQNGNLLPFWSGCILLTTQQVAVLSHYSEDSLDSRLFGPIESTKAIQYRPLWLFN